MLPRFLAPSAAASGSVITLPEEEGAHLARVLRLKAGDPIRVFDGRGREWSGAVETVTRGAVAVRLGDAVAPVPEPGVAITLCTSVLKADHMDEVVRDAVMLGVHEIRPLLTGHTEISAHVIERSGRVARWQRIAVSSAKQCGRAVVPLVAGPVALDAALAGPHAHRIVLVEPNAAAPEIARLHDLSRVEAVELFVGPEGGWAAAEVARMSASGAILVTLGRQTFRAAAAPVVAISALRAMWRDL